MDQRACPSCGAQNAAHAAYCWQCFARFAPGGPAPAPPVRGSALVAALGTGPGAGTPSAVLAEPATVTRWHPETSATSDRAAGWLIRGLVAVLAGLVGFFGYQWLTRGFELPEQVGGQPRMEGDLVEEFEDLLDGFGGAFDVELEMAIYGRGVPTYFLAGAQVPDGQDVDMFYQGFVAGSGTSTEFGSVDPNVLTCISFPGGAGAQCSWAQDEVVLLLQGFTGTEDDLAGVAETVRSDLG